MWKIYLFSLIHLQLSNKSAMIKLAVLGAEEATILYVL